VISLQGKRGNGGGARVRENRRHDRSVCPLEVIVVDNNSSAAAVGGYDASAGEAAFRALEGTLRGMAAEEVTTPNSDVQKSALAALNLVQVAREPAIQAALASLPGAVMDTVDRLEQAAWATWYAHTRVLARAVQRRGTRVNAELYERSGQHLARMLKVLAYHLDAVPEVVAEIADIRTGHGYQDRASDLARAAVLCERWRDELERDRRHFDPDDAGMARTYARSILIELRDSAGGRVAAEEVDLRNRTWTLLVRSYAEIRAAGAYVFRDDPAQRARFVPLRQAAHPRRPTRRTITTLQQEANGAREAAPDQAASPPRAEVRTPPVHHAPDTEPDRSVSEGPPRCRVRRALGRHPTRRSGAARRFRRFDRDLCDSLGLAKGGGGRTSPPGGRADLIGRFASPRNDCCGSGPEPTVASIVELRLAPPGPVD
jgi:hypothetical protein